MHLRSMYDVSGCCVYKGYALFMSQHGYATYVISSSYVMTIGIPSRE